jgi:hypothetical protein
MRFFRHHFLVLQAVLSVTNTAGNPVQTDSSEVIASEPHDTLAESQGRNGSYYLGTHGCGSRINGRSRIPILANEAARTWGRKHMCGPMEYWRLTPESMRDSGAGDFFLSWMDRYHSGLYQHECDNARLTAIQCFASMWWGDFDYKCPIDQIERCSVPTAYDITAWIQEHNDWSESEVTDTARKVYFIYKHFQVVISDLKTDWVKLSFLQVLPCC